MARFLLSLIACSQRFLITWRFPVFALGVISALLALLIFMMLVPEGNSALGAFAHEFRVWCFDYDPVTGVYSWGAVTASITELLLLAFIIYGVYAEPLREGRQTARRTVLPYIVVGAVLVGGSAGALASGAQPVDSDERFPEQALRVAHRFPPIALLDESGEQVSVPQGERVVTVVTAFYAHCPHSCPLIVAEIKRLLNELSPELKARVRVQAITMDPATDGVAQLADYKLRQGLTSEPVSFLTGDPSRVNWALDLLDFARSRDQASGVITHANLFLLFDTEGKLAYRLALSADRPRWLNDAVASLLRE